MDRHRLVGREVGEQRHQRAVAHAVREGEPRQAHDAKPLQGELQLHLAIATSDPAVDVELEHSSVDLELPAVEVGPFARHDAGMAQQVAWSTGKPGTENRFLSLEADTAAYYGRLRQARELSRRAVNSAKRAEEIEVAAEYEGNAALTEALFGNSIEDRGQATDELDSSKWPAAQFLAALALAFAGDERRAGVIADDLGNRFRENTLVQSYYLPTIRAQLALRRNDPARAIEVLKTAAPYELSSAGRMYPVYVRGESYLSSHRGNEAAAEFQKILDYRGLMANAPIGALAHLGLGRAHALQSRTSQGAHAEAARVWALAAYKDFLTLWKDADPNILVLKQAKAEYARLQ